jgi:hypothetical protein
VQKVTGITPEDVGMKSSGDVDSCLFFVDIIYYSDPSPWHANYIPN